MVVSRQSATNAGEKQEVFLAPFLPKSSINLSEKGSIQPLPNLD